MEQRDEQDVPPRESDNTAGRGPRRYFVIKCSGAGSLHRSMATGQWATPWRKTPPQPHHLLQQAYAEAEEVVLLFSVAGTKSWKGYAVMTSATGDAASGDGDPSAFPAFSGLADEVQALDRLAPPIGVRWVRHFPDVVQQGLPFARTAALLNQLDGGQTVNLSRNCQEVSTTEAEELCALLDEAVAVEERKAAEALRQREEEKAKQTHFFVVSEDTAHSTRWAGFVEEVSKVGTLLYAGHIGSRSYNLHTAQSDVDMLAIAAYPTEQILSFVPPKHTIKNAEGFEPDFTLHEVAYFCHLLLHGDARMVEALFQDEHAVVCQSEEFAVLRKNRDLFLTKQVLDKYLGEATGSKGIPRLLKMHQTLKPGDQEGALWLCKKWYIVHRLLVQARQLVSGQGLTLWLDDASEDRQFLLNVRQGLFEPHDLLARAQLALDEIRRSAAASDCPLPAEVSPAGKALVQDWLLKLRLSRVPPVPSSFPAASEAAAGLPELGLDAATTGPILLLTRRDNTYFGVHATPPRLLLADHAVRSSATVKTLSAEAAGGDKVDCQLYDVSKFAEMLQAGSPTCLEALFPDRSGPASSSSLSYLYESPQWLELKRVRDQLVTPHALRRLVGYLDGQLRQLRKKKGKNWQRQKQKPQSADVAGPEEPVPAEFWRLLALLDSLLLDARETSCDAPPVAAAASGSPADAQAALSVLAAKCELVEDRPGTDDAVNLTLHHWVVNVRSTLL